MAALPCDERARPSSWTDSEQRMPQPGSGKARASPHRLTELEIDSNGLSQVTLPTLSPLIPHESIPKARLPAAENNVAALLMACCAYRKEPQRPRSRFYKL